MKYTTQQASQIINKDVSTTNFWKKKYQGYIEMTGAGRKGRITETGILQLKLIAELSNKGKSFSEIVEILKERYPVEAIGITTPVTIEDTIRKAIEELVLPEITRLQTSLDKVLNKLDISEKTAEPVEDVQSVEIENIQDDTLEDVQEMTQEEAVVAVVGGYQDDEEVKTNEETVISPEKLLEIMTDIKSQFPNRNEAQKRADAMNKTNIPANKKSGLWTSKNFGDKFLKLKKKLK